MRKLIERLPHFLPSQMPRPLGRALAQKDEHRRPFRWQCQWQRLHWRLPRFAVSAPRGIQMIRLATLTLLLVPVTLHAELIVGSALTIDDSSPLIGDLSIDIAFGDSYFLTKPNLELDSFTIGVQTFVYDVELGDTLTNQNVLDFPLILPAPFGEPIAIPAGESYIGFAVRESDFNAPFSLIGWAKLLRTDDGSLEVLANAAEYGGSALSPSEGIVVGVPEPSGAGVLLPLIAACSLARRTRSAEEKPRCITSS